MRPPISLSSSGFTLIEIMIAAAITFVLAFGITTLLTGTNRIEANIRLKQEAFNYQQQIRYERKTAPPPSPDP